MNDLDAARQRISELEDNTARLEGRMGTALNRIRELEDELKIWKAKPDRDKLWRAQAIQSIRQRTEERNALREGLEKCITVMNRLSLFTSDSLGGMTALNAIEGDEALASAQALLSCKESINSEESLDRKDLGTDVVPNPAEAQP